MSEKLTISSESDLRSNLGIDETISFEVFKNPIEATKEELNKLKDEISKLTESTRKTEIINGFLKEKQETVDQTKTDIGNLLKTGGVAGIAGGLLNSLQDTINEDDGKEGVEKVLSLGEKLTAWWDKITLSFQSLMWEKFPSLAKMFGIEDPSERLKQEAKEKKQKAEENAKEQEKKVAETIKPGYNFYTKIYFKLFKGSNELDSDFKVDKNLEGEVARCVFEHTKFKDLKYNELNSNNAQIILKSIKGNLKLDKQYSDEVLLKYVNLVFKSISSGEETTKTGTWFKSDKTGKIERGNTFLNKHFKNIKQENPSMRELFSNLNNLGDFELFGEDSQFDIDSLKESLKGKTQSLYDSGVTNIANLKESDFSKLKGGLSSKLQNLGDFQLISNNILKSSDSLTLNNNFEANGVENNPKNKDGLVSDFIGDNEKGLIKYGNDLYNNILKSGSLIDSSKNIKKEDLTLKKVYAMYLMTGGETNLEKLSTMQKLNLTFSIMTSHGNAGDIGAGLGNMVEKIMNNEITIDSDVKNLLLSIGSASINMIKDAGKFMGEIGWGFAQKQPVLATGILVILLKFPFFVKRHSLI
ncbi:hypothetical protein H3C61_01110 [Candidatus Gracilibacteria bacterium]|nr:hypothetical protein [Candidatus Gracilibacteria bacterium]